MPMAAVAALLAGAMFSLSRVKYRMVGFALAWVALLWTACWMWWAPPSPIAQQSFNYRSLSHDGAFVVEAEHIDSLADYLRHFDERRLTVPIELMGGTRVLSNPPGAAILCYAVIKLFPSSPDSKNRLEQMLMRDYDVAPVDVPITADALRCSAAFVLLWAMSSVLAYFLGRVFVSPQGALLFAVLVTFNPCAVHFTPGKDSVQLVTINAMLWMWFLGWRRKSVMFSGISGAFLVIGATLGLIHFWIAAAMIAATVWHDRKIPVKQMGAFAIGAIAVVAMVYLAIGWNIPATLLAVARRFAQVQKTFQMNHLIWFGIGLPLFLLFIAPGAWVFAAMHLRRFRLGLGMKLVICTLAVMLLTYAIGVTYELPRLWVAFIPPLMLGLMIDRPIAKSRSSATVTRAMIVIMTIHILFTAYHWTILDARESEYRLLSNRLFQ
jgi:hypothetical protein